MIMDNQRAPVCPYELGDDCEVVWHRRNLPSLMPRHWSILHDPPRDGNCMYTAFLYCIGSNGRDACQDLRADVCQFLLHHCDDQVSKHHPSTFRQSMVHNLGDMISRRIDSNVDTSMLTDDSIDPIQRYTAAMLDSTPHSCEYGTQLELAAIAHIYQVNIVVYTQCLHNSNGERMTSNDDYSKWHDIHIRDGIPNICLLYSDTCQHYFSMIPSERYAELSKQEHIQQGTAAASGVYVQDPNVISTFISMGFDESSARRCMEDANGDVELAASMLISESSGNNNMSHHNSGHAETERDQSDGIVIISDGDNHSDVNLDLADSQCHPSNHTTDGSVDDDEDDNDFYQWLAPDEEQFDEEERVEEEEVDEDEDEEDYAVADDTDEMHDDDSGNFSVYGAYKIIFLLLGTDLQTQSFISSKSLFIRYAQVLQLQTETV